MRFFLIADAWNKKGTIVSWPPIRRPAFADIFLQDSPVLLTHGAQVSVWENGAFVFRQSGLPGLSSRHFFDAVNQLAVVDGRGVPVEAGEFSKLPHGAAENKTTSRISILFGGFASTQVWNAVLVLEYGHISETKRFSMKIKWPLGTGVPSSGASLPPLPGEE